MKTIFLILLFFALIMVLYALFTKKRKTSEKDLQTKSLQKSSDIVLRSNNNDVKIVLIIEKDENKDEKIIKAKIYIKNKPISVSGNPLLFEIGPLTEKFPTPQKVLKRIYLLSTATNFLSHPSSSRFKSRLLYRIFSIRAQNIQRKVFKAIQLFNPPLYKKLKKQHDLEQQMTELLLSKTRENEKNMQEELDKYRSSIINNGVTNTKQDIDLSNEEMVNIIPESEIKNYQSSQKDFSDESLVNVLPKNELKSRRIFDKIERT